MQMNSWTIFYLLHNEVTQEAQFHVFYVLNSVLITGHRIRFLCKLSDACVLLLCVSFQFASELPLTDVFISIT